MINRQWNSKPNKETCLKQSKSWIKWVKEWSRWMKKNKSVKNIWWGWVMNWKIWTKFWNIKIRQWIRFMSSSSSGNKKS